MADVKITALTAISANPVNPATFPMPMVDLLDTSMAASGSTRKVTVNQILGSGGTATLASATITGALTANGGVNLANATAINFGGLLTIYSDTAAGLFIRGRTTGGTTFQTQDGTNPLLNITNAGVFTFSDGAGGTRMTLNSTGLSVGVTPSAWGSNNKALQVGANSGAISSSGSGNTSSRFSHGCYFDGTNWLYSVSSVGAARYEITGANTGSSHAWHIAAGGTAGNAITFTQAMTLDASGNLLTGTTSTGGSSSNATKTVGGSFSTVNGVSASTATAVAVTLFAVPTEAVFIVSAFVPAYAAPTLYNAVSIVKVNGGVATVTALSTGTNISISTSGLNVQATQITGGASTISYSAIRIS